MNVSLVQRIRMSIDWFATIARAIANDLKRLNSARMDSATLASMPPRARRRMVKAALREHHRDPRRCC